MSDIANQTAAFVKDVFREEQVLLHRPVFAGHEKEYLAECIDSNFVSSVGARVAEFEQRIAAYTGARFAIATMNGTAALHIALRMAGAAPETEILTQALTFVATCNAAAYCGTVPVFIDVDRDTLGMSPAALRAFLQEHAEMRGGQAYNRGSGRRIVACVPMHTFGHPLRVAEIAAVCEEWGVTLIEDAAESLGSFVGERHTGNFGRMATLSFNGNKIITTGGGGMVITNDEALAKRLKHVTTTAKVPHPYEYVHDELGFNYRLPNLNAALGVAQMEQLPGFVRHKRKLAERYAEFFRGKAGVQFVREPEGCSSNYWLNAIVLPSLAERDAFLQATNAQGVMTRPIWRLMTHLPLFRDCQHDGLANAQWLEERVVNVPSSVPLHWLEGG